MPARLEIQSPQAIDKTAVQETYEWLWHEMSNQEIAESLDKVYNLGGIEDREASVSLRGEKGEGGDFVAFNARQALTDHLMSLSSDFSELEESGADGLRYIEFDPEEWSGSDKEFYDFATGRLYWLAASGVLGRLGYQVTAPGLD